MDLEAPQSSKILEEPQPVEWESLQRAKVPWIKESVHYAETIPPQKDQKSNNDISLASVLQPRDEPVGTNSVARPLHTKDHAPAGMFEGGGGPDLGGSQGS